MALSLGNHFGLSEQEIAILDFKDTIISFAALTLLPILYKKFNVRNCEFTVSQLIFLIFFFYASISYLWIDNDLNDKLYFLDKWFAYALAAILISSIVLSYKSQYKFFLIYTIVISALVVCLIYFGQKYLLSIDSKFSLPLFESFLKLIPVINQIEFGSTFGNINAVSHFLVFVTPITMYLIVKPKTKYVFVFGMISFFIIIFFIYESNTLASLIALILQIILFFSIYISIKFQLSLKKFFWLFFLFIFIFISLSQISQKNNFLNNAYKDIVTKFEFKDAPRKFIYEATLEEIQKAPFFGHGLGSFVPRMQNNGSNIAVLRAHNSFLQIALELGLIGLLLLFVSLFRVYKDFRQIVAYSSDSIFYVSIFLGISGSFIIGLFSWPYSHLSAYIMFSIYIGLIIKEAKKYSHTEKINPNSIIRNFLRFFAIFTLVSFPIFSINSLNAKVSLIKGIGLWEGNLEIDNIKKYIAYDVAWIAKAATLHTDNFSVNQTKMYELILSEDRDNSFATHKLIKNYINEENIEKAESLLNNIHHDLLSNPNILDASLNIASARNDKNLMEKYYSNLKNEALKDSNRPFKDYRIYVYLINWALKTHNYQDAFFAYNFLDKIREKTVHIELKMADAYFLSGKYREALPHINFLIGYRENLVKKSVIDFFLINKLLSKTELDALREKSVKRSLNFIKETIKTNRLSMAKPEIKYLIEYYPGLLPENFIQMLIKRNIVNKNDLIVSQ